MNNKQELIKYLDEHYTFGFTMDTPLIEIADQISGVFSIIKQHMPTTYKVELITYCGIGDFITYEGSGKTLDEALCKAIMFKLNPSGEQK